MTSYQASLYYRAAVLMEKSEMLYVRKLNLLTLYDKKKCDEEMDLLVLERREIERMTPEAARYAA
ncbi:MAG TPA: hypothetical protein VGK24_05235 [Candidatus Angelobacter sp.]|jgi:hypothetical protein